jgi:hypothetical protein
MKFAVEIGWTAMLYISNLKENSSNIQKWISWIHRQHDDRIIPLSLYQSKENFYLRFCIAVKLGL